jgi:hypothetical protein
METENDIVELNRYDSGWIFGQVLFLWDKYRYNI